MDYVRAEHGDSERVRGHLLARLNPAKRVFGPADKIAVPPSGILAGVYARTDGATPGGVYNPPAGIDKGRMFGFETDEVLEEAKRDLVYPKRINPLHHGPEPAALHHGSRTLKGDSNFPYVAERRGVIFIERSLKQGLRAQVRRTITAFLLTQMNNGAFRSREPSKALFTDELNTPSVIFAGKLIERGSRVHRAENFPGHPSARSRAGRGRRVRDDISAASARWSWRTSSTSRATRSSPTRVRAA